jgi:capsid protein
MKAVLRGASAGMGISYNSLSSDLEGVNFSSIRQGVLEDRDWYKIITGWLTEHSHDDYFPEWLEMAIITGHVNLPILRFNKFNAPHWRGRGFSWVDPLKDTKANVEACNNYHTSPQKVCEEKGDELEEIIEDHVEFHEMLRENNLPVPNQATTNLITDEEEVQGDGTEKSESE